MPKKLKKETRIHKFIKEHFMVIVVLAITLIPSIYTVLFLGSMWDPYGNTGSLPVAIVNEDEAVIYGGKEVNIGEMLCDNLKKNKQLQFNFVDEQVALDGLENGTYYMVLVVPKNFSYNSTTLTSSNPQKMVLDYYVNPGTNYIASKFGESGVKSIKESINKSVINTYATTVYSKLNTIGDGFTRAADGSGQIYDGAGQLRGGNAQITGGLKTLSNGCLTLRKGTGTLQDGLKTYTDGVAQVDGGVKQLYDGVPLLSDGITQLQDGAVQLKDGTTQLKDGSIQLKDGTFQLKDGAFQLKDGTVQLRDGTAQLKDGTSQLVANNDALNSGAQQLLDGLNTMSAQLDESLTEENLNDLKRLEDGLLELNAGIQTLQKAVNEDYKISDETINTIKSTIADVEAFTKSDEFELLSTVVSYSLIDWTRIDSLCNTLELLPLSQSNKTAVENLRSLSQTMQKLQNFGTKITPENAEELVRMANSLIDAYYMLSDGVQQLSDGGNQALPVASDTLKTLTNGLQSIQNGLDRTVEKDGETGLIEGMTTLKNGIAQYTDGVTQVDSGVTQVNDGAVRLSDGAIQLNDGAIQLNDGAVQLSDGAIQLDDGVFRLKDGLTQLGDGFGTAGDGINRLYDGTQQLVANNNKINSGASQLNSGAVQLYDGSLKLYNGTLQIDAGCEKLMFGANTLKESLEDGAAQISETNTGESAAEMFAQPVEANETFQRTINTNGEAMSAYMMCAGLWVACLAFCLMFSPFKTSLGSRKTFIGHALIAMFVSMVQAPIMVTLLMAINGMRPQNVGLTYLMAILASMAFMSIVYYLNTLLDSIGSFFLLILLCLQLSGAAGTYPIELSPKFYQIIHPFMPFAYGVDAFRSTLSTGNPLTKDIIVFVCIIAGGIIATCLTYEFRRKKLKRKAQTQQIELTEQTV